MGEMQSKAVHKLVLELRKKVTLTGVNDVCSFHENEVVLKTDSGVLVITGENLHVGKLVLEEGCVDVQGRIDMLSYEVQHNAKRIWPFGKRI